MQTGTAMNPISRSQVYRFRSRANAFSFAGRCVQAHWVMLGAHDGEEGEYLVATPADCARLERAGYEFA